jgi:hypothetical protein
MAKSWKTTDPLDHFSLEKSILKLFLASLTIGISLSLNFHEPVLLAYPQEI